MKHTRAFLTALLMAPLAALPVAGATNSDFERKAATLFTKEYSFHAWDETNAVFRSFRHRKPGNP